MKKKHSFLVIFLSFLTLISYCQNWDWYKHFINPGTITNPTSEALDITAVKIDDNNDIIIYGSFKDTLIVDGVTYLSSGATDLFLAKYSSTGNLLWFRIFGAADEEISENMALDDNGNIFLTGAFRGTTNFQGFNITADHKRDGFLVKINSAGSVQWLIKAVGGTENQVGFGIAVDPLGEIYLSGTFKTEAVFTSQTFTVQKSNVNNFLAKYDVTGAEIWSQQIICSNTLTRLFEIKAYNANEIYMGGFFADTLEFGARQAVSNGNTSEDIIVIKITNLGIPVWARQAGSVTSDRCNGIDADIYGNIYLTGYISGTAQFDSTGLGLADGNSLISVGGLDMFVAKYNKNGTLQWTSRNGNTGDDIGYGVSTIENIVQFSGYFSDEIIFNLDTLRSSGPTDQNTGFFVYNTSGDAINGREMTGPGEERGSAITFDVDEGATYIGGMFDSDTLKFGSNQIIRGSNNQEGLIAKYLNPFTAAFTDVENIDCNGNSNGRLIVTPYFGVGPYSYSWSANVTDSNDSLAYNLSADTYSVTITDSRLETASNTIVLNEPLPISIGFVTTDVSCHPANGTSNNGSIDITAGGGTGPGTYAYAWEAISGSGINPTNEDQTNLTMGEYSVTVTDGNLCAEDDTFAIDQPDKILFTGSSIINHITIPPGSNGEVDLVVSGGTPGYSYSWTGPQSYSSSNEDISGLSIGGNYTVQVSDAVLAPNTCTADTSFTVLSDTMLIAYISDKTDVDCKGNYTGSATVDVSGGSGPFVYNWSNGATSQTISNLPTGSYSVTVNNATDTSITSVFINEPLYELSSTVVGTDLVCFRDNSGTANLSVSGGTLPYAYSWSNGTTTEDLIHVAASDYYVTVTDKNGCQVIDGVTLDEPAAMDISISVDQPVLCHGDMTGILTATATGGTGTKTYVWDDPGNQTAQTATNLGGGFYNVTATDLNECTVVGNVQLTEPAVLTLTPVSYDISCAGEEDGTIILTISGGTPSFSFVWSNNEFTQNITGLEAGIYSVTVTDQHNCTGVLADIEILEPEGTTLVSEDVTNTSCFLTEDGSISIDAVNPADNLTFSIDGSIYMNNNGVFLNLPQGNYEVWVMDGDGCEQLLTSLTVSGPGPITLDTTVTHALGNQGGTVIAVASGGNEPYNYFLISSSTDMDNSTGEFYDIAPDNYELYAVDNISCPSDTLLITILQTSSNIVIYDAFSPNADGRNDLWNIGNIGLYPDCKVIVFNTWGNKVFSSDGYTEPWDGKYNGKDLPAGTYYYTIDLGDGSEVLSGPVSIVR